MLTHLSLHAHVVGFSSSRVPVVTVRLQDLNKRQGLALLTKVGESVKHVAGGYKLRARPAEFCAMGEYLDTFTQKLGTIDRIAQRILKEQSGIRQIEEFDSSPSFFSGMTCRHFHLPILLYFTQNIIVVKLCVEALGCNKHFHWLQSWSHFFIVFPNMYFRHQEATFWNSGVCAACDTALSSTLYTLLLLSVDLLTGSYLYTMRYIVLVVSVCHEMVQSVASWLTLACMNLSAVLT